MSQLGDKIRKAREFTREIEGWRLRLRRPTDVEAASILRTGARDALTVATTFVIGWEGVKESDLVPSGNNGEIEFDADAWAEIVADRPELWEPLSTAIVDSWVQFNEAREDRKKS